MMLFAGFIDFMSQDMVFWPLTGLCCTTSILTPIAIVILVLRINKKKTRDRDSVGDIDHDE